MATGYILMRDDGRYVQERADDTASYVSDIADATVFDVEDANNCALRYDCPVLLYVRSEVAVISARSATREA